MNKTILSIILVTILIFSALINLPLVPENNYKTTNTTIKFEKLGYGPILIDNNKEFSSPLLLKEPFIITLQPDTYYWKSLYISKTNTFTINSKIALSLTKENSTPIIQNKGNVPENIEIKKNSILTGFAILDIREKLRINLSDEEVIASQK